MRGEPSDCWRSAGAVVQMPSRRRGARPCTLEVRIDSQIAVYTRRFDYRFRSVVPAVVESRCIRRVSTTAWHEATPRAGCFSRGRG